MTQGHLPRETPSESEDLEEKVKRLESEITVLKEEVGVLLDAVKYLAIEAERHCPGDKKTKMRSIKGKIARKEYERKQER